MRSKPSSTSRVNLDACQTSATSRLLPISLGLRQREFYCRHRSRRTAKYLEDLADAEKFHVRILQAIQQHALGRRHSVVVAISGTGKSAGASRERPRNHTPHFIRPARGERAFPIRAFFRAANRKEAVAHCLKRIEPIRVLPSRAQRRRSGPNATRKHFYGLGGNTPRFRFSGLHLPTDHYL